jgi:hypothetical protein
MGTLVQEFELVKSEKGQIDDDLAGSSLGSAAANQGLYVNESLLRS